MKTFMNNKYSYLMAAAVLAGSMSFTACTNEEDVINPLEGPKSSVTLGLSVAGLGTKASANDVNLGGTENLQQIENIVVAPMVSGQYSYPIALGSLNPAEGNRSLSKKVQLMNTVDQFRVFGNVPTDKLTAVETSAFAGFSYTPATIAETNYIEPYTLLYHADTKEEGFYAATGTWAEVQDWGQKTRQIGTNTAIKVDNVKYAVGVVAVAVLDGLKGGTDAYPSIAYSTEQDALDQKNAEAIDGNTFKVAAVKIGGQKDAFTDKGWSNTADKNVYEEAVLVDMVSDKINNNNLGQNELTGANIYSVVTPTEVGAKIDFSVRMQNKSEKYIRMANGEIVKPEGYTYYNVTLDASKLTVGADKAVFAEATTTILNLTIMKWEKGTAEPVESTELEMGIEVDMSWTAGLVFDQDI